MRVGVIDYGVGNLGSVLRALEELRARPILITCAIEVQTVDSLILPGVGSFSDCAKLLNNGGWVHALQDEVCANAKPLLGICLGMQLLATSSVEGIDENESRSTHGLDFISGRVESLQSLGCDLRIPHVGWNEVKSCTSNNRLFDGIPDGTDFYFAHSYSFVPDDSLHVLATTDYGISITAAVRRGHIWGTQFHPEKSSRAGFQLLRNFIEHPKC
jgi:imidazole glycerol-phosphate synthase subunit HisH